MLKRWKPADVIALVIVVACATLLMTGRDSIISYALLGVVVCYFGIDLSGIVDIVKGRRRK
jgi:hypothetical protein